jgi:hypothetical protein
MFPAYGENNRFGRRDSEACSGHENTAGLTRLPIKTEEGPDRIQFVGQIHVVHSVTKTLSGGRSRPTERSSRVDQDAGRSLGQSRGQSFVALQDQTLSAGRRLLNDSQQPRLIPSHQDNPSATADKFGGYRASGTPTCASYPDLHHNYVTLRTVCAPQFRAYSDEHNNPEHRHPADNIDGLSGS